MKLAELHELWRMGIIGDRELIETQIARILSKGKLAEAWSRNGVKLVGIRIDPATGLDEGLRVELEAMGPTATLAAGAFGLKSDRVRNQYYILNWMMERPDTLKSMLENKLIDLHQHLVPGGEFESGRELGKYDPITGYV